MSKKILDIPWSSHPDIPLTSEIDLTRFYNSFDLMIRNLIEQIIGEEDQFDIVLAIKSGGWIPGVVIAKALDLPLCDAHSALYRGDYFNKNILFVDDILHSGETIRKIIVPSIKYWKLACLVKNELAPEGLVWKYTLDVDKDTWVHFPWEPYPSEEEGTQLLKKHTQLYEKQKIIQ